MENKLEKITARLIRDTYRQIGLIDIKTQNTTMFSMEDSGNSSANCYPYENFVTNISSSLASPYREQLRRQLQFPQILKALGETESDVLIEFEPSHSGEKVRFFLIAFSWYDISKSSIIMTVSEETKRMSEKLELIQKLRRIEDRFDFLRTHICEDFIEVNIYTGECTTIHSNNNMIFKVQL